MNESDAQRESDLGMGSRSSVFLGCIWKCRWLEMSIFRGVLNSKSQEQQNRKIESKLVMDGIGAIKCCQSSEENELVDGDECEKKGIEESLNRGLYMLWWQAWSEFYCEPIGSQWNCWRRGSKCAKLSDWRTILAREFGIRWSLCLRWRYISDGGNRKQRNVWGLDIDAECCLRCVMTWWSSLQTWVLP